MKIFPVEKIREADEYTILHEPITHVDLMERAANACFEWLYKNIHPGKRILVFCGAGNNGGDGMVIARLMATRKFSLAVYIFGPEEKFTPSSRSNYDRLVKISEIDIQFVKESDPLPVLSKDDIVIDAMIGSGLTKPVTGFYSTVIEHINQSNSVVVSIDIPSGLFSDFTMSGYPKPSVVHADYTLTFSPLKIAFMFPENDPFVGNWFPLDIGISEEFINKTETMNQYLTPDDISPMLKSRNIYGHKGQFGHVLLVCGRVGKMGAAVLGARASLRSGAGLVTTHIPKGGNIIIQTSVPEAMTEPDVSEEMFTTHGDLTPYNSIAVGPGIGQSDETAKALKHLIQNAGIPVIFDADAINILSENKTWISFLPKGSILTPHPKEFERLVGKTFDHFERNQVQRDFSKKYGVYVILKGAHSAITSPDGQCYFNSTGNPGMATGGSGDVLTGILAGLKAQGYSSLETCLIGTYIHGLAGNFAALECGYEALIAGDIVENMGKAFLSAHGSSPISNYQE